MALQECKECGGRVSSKAQSCPSCGAPRQKPTGAATSCLVIVAVVIIILICAKVFNFDSSPSRPAPARPASGQSSPSSEETASQTLGMGAADKTVATPEAMKTWTLGIAALKVYQTSRSHAAIDMRFINSSPNDIQHWSLNVEVYDNAGAYLARGEGMVSHLNAGQSKVEAILLLDTQVSRIDRWTATLGGIVGYSGLREDKKYELRVKE